MTMSRRRLKINTPNPVITETTSALSPISPWPPPLPSTTHTPEPPLPSSKEIYGFIAVLLTYLSFIIYLIWAFLPPRWLDYIGWTWYPDREWAIVIPCYLMVLVLLAYLSYAGLTAYHTPSFDSISLITDPYSNIPSTIHASDPPVEPYYWEFTDPKAIPIARDLPIDLVNRVLYPPRKRPKKD